MFNPVEQFVIDDPLADRMPDTECLKSCWNFVHAGIERGDIVSAWAVGFGGIGEALVKMGLGNRFGASVTISEPDLYNLSYGSILVEGSIRKPLSPKKVDEVADLKRR